MKTTFKINTLSAAVLLAAGAQSALALPPTANPNITIYISGGGAQDPALDGFIEKLAISGSFDLYYDNQNPSNPGQRFRAYFFQTNNTLIPGLSSGATPVNVLIYKRTYGAAGYGVVPVLADNYQTRQLDIKAAGAATAPANGEKFWRVSTNNLQNTVSDAGLTGVGIELFYGINYPAAVGDDTPFPQLDISKASEKLTIKPAGGLAYGIGVTLDLYKTLQAAQIATGTLPPETQIGDYSKESSIPTLSRNFLASLISGKIRTWDEVRVVDERPIATGATKGEDKGSLTDIARGIGLEPPLTNGKNLVAVANRNKGAAVGAALSAKVLNAPGTQNALNPATSPGNPTNGPIVTQPPGTGQVDGVLTDWQNGGNASTYNADGLKHWGIGQQSLDFNASGALGKDPVRPYRFIRIDGYAPSLQNVASGNYPVWAESTFQWRNQANGGPSGDKLVILERLADDIGSPAVAAAVNAKILTTFGPSGVFALSSNNTITSNEPFDLSKPVVNYTHTNGGVLNNSITPVHNSSKPGSVTLK